MFWLTFTVLSLGANRFALLVGHGSHYPDLRRKLVVRLPQRLVLKPVPN